MWNNVKSLAVITCIVLLFAVIGVAASHHFRLGPALAQEPGQSDLIPADRILSSSTTADARVELRLTIGSLPAAMPVGGSVELYLDEAFQVPDFIGVDSLYVVATNPITRETGSSARVYAVIPAKIRNGSHFGNSNDWSIQVFIPDLCTNLTEECEGSNGPMQGQTLTLVIDDSAGIKNPSEAGNYSVGYSLLGPVDRDNRGPQVRLDNLATYAKIGLSDVGNRRDYELTVTGAGFNNGTTGAVYVLHDPSVGSEAFDDSVNEAALCERIISEGACAGGALVGSDDRVAVTFAVTVPTFGPGNTNYICMVDGEGRTSHTDVERFHLEHSVRVGPSTVKTGDTTTVFAQDFPNIGAGLTELKLAGRTVVPADSSTSIGADGSATATFTVPDGLVGTIGVEAAWGAVSANTRMTVVAATQTPPLVRPYNVRAASNAAGTLALTWEGGDNADSYVLIAVHMGTFDYETTSIGDGAAKTGTVTGLIGGEDYLGIVVALQVLGDGSLETLHGSAAPVQVQSGGPATDRAVLVALYNATGGANWTDSTNWLSSVPISQWHGVITDDDGRVIVLDLARNGLAGPLPPELGGLSRLKHLIITDNRLSGSIPSELGNLSNLVGLYLTFNDFSGEMPAELGNLTKLRALHLLGNDLTGGIPIWLSRFSELRELTLGINQLTGPIPSWLGDLAHLKHINLRDNQLEGEIPAELGNLSRLEELYANRNRLSGSMPSELGRLSRLKELDLCGNELSGEIPSELGNLSNLTDLILCSNELSGQIPAELHKLAHLEELVLSRNQLIGEIPPWLGGLPELRGLSLADNQFTGTIPANLSTLVKLRSLNLQGNGLTGIVPTWLGNLPKLMTLDLASNRLDGPIPMELGNLTGLVHLRLDDNRLRGEIPPALGNLTNLVRLFLGNNQLTGCIPSALQNVEHSDVDQLGLPFCAQ